MESKLLAEKYGSDFAERRELIKRCEALLREGEKAAPAEVKRYLSECVRALKG